MAPAEKKPEDQLFDTMDATDLNKRLKDLMDGLSVKVYLSSFPLHTFGLMGLDTTSGIHESA